MPSNVPQSLKRCKTVDMRTLAALRQTLVLKSESGQPLASPATVHTCIYHMKKRMEPCRSKGLHERSAKATVYMQHLLQFMNGVCTCPAMGRAWYAAVHSVIECNTRPQHLAECGGV